MAKVAPRTLASTEEWKHMMKCVSDKAPWKKGLPFLQGVTTEDRAAYQGVIQGYQMAIDVLNEIASPTPQTKLPDTTYQS